MINLQRETSSGLFRIENDNVELHLSHIRLSIAPPQAQIVSQPEEQLLNLECAFLLGVDHAVLRHSLGEQEHWTFRYAPEHGCELTWQVGFIAANGCVTLRLMITNRSDRPVRVRSLMPLRTGPGKLAASGSPASWKLSSITHTQRQADLAEVLPSENECTLKIWQGWGMSLPNALPTDEYAIDGHWRSFTDTLTLYSTEQSEGLLIGPCGSPEAYLQHRCHVAKGSIELRSWSEMSDIVLVPGETRESQEVAVLPGRYEDSAKILLNHLADTHGRRTHRGPVFGWCSWYSYWGDVTAAEVLAVTRGMRSAALPIQTIQIDDGFQRQVGDWTPNDKFPDGFAEIIREVKAAGALPGIWLAPLACHGSAKVFAEHPDWFQRDAKGNLNGTAENWGKTTHWLDPTHPETRRFIMDVVRGYREKGFEYFKIDFNNLENGTRFHDPTKTSLQVFRDLYRDYRRAIGEGAYLLACSGFKRGVLGFADAARIGPDSCPTWESLHPCTIVECIRATGNTAVANGVFLFNDPDVTYSVLRQPLTLEEWHTWHSFVGLLGGMTLVPDQFHKLEGAAKTDAIREAERLSPPSPERARSFRGGVDFDHTRFGFVASRPWGDFAALVLWNPASLPRQMAIECPELDRALGSNVLAWSFWDGRTIGVGRPSELGAMIPQHGCLLLRLTPLHPQYPTLVGSDLHVSAGTAEIGTVRATAGEFSIQLTDAGATSGSLFVYSPRPLQLRGASGLRVESVVRGAYEVWKISIADRKRGEAQSIELTVG